MEIACRLSEAAAGAQLRGWADLGSALRRSDPAHGRLRLWFGAEVEAKVREMAAKEKECCPFLDLTVTTDGDAVRLEIGSDLPEAQPVVDALRDAIGTARP